MGPLVSIGVAVRNGSPLIDRAMQSLRRQTWSNLELLVSDNGSTDDTPEILRRHAAEDPRVQIERIEPHDTSIDNFARVLRRATGEYFMWAGHDDDWAPDHIERLVRLLEGDPAAVVAAAITELVDVDGRVLRTYERAVDLPRADRVERLIAFIEQPEPQGKANLMLGLFRRRELATVDMVEFLGADKRRQDYHVVLAILLLGDLRVDPELRFLKTRSPTPPRRLARRVLDGVRNTKVAADWIAAYPQVIEERAALTDAERQVIRRAVRRRLRQYYRQRIAWVLRSLAGRESS